MRSLSCCFCSWLFVPFVSSLSLIGSCHINERKILQLLLSFSSLLSSIDSCHLDKEETKRKFCQIFIHPYWKRRRKKERKIELECLLNMPTDKHFLLLLYTIIFCQIRTNLSIAMITKNEKRASVALIIHPIDYRSSSSRHISDCLILHAIMNSSLSLFLLSHCTVKEKKKLRRIVPMISLRVNAHYHHIVLHYARCDNPVGICAIRSFEKNQFSLSV